MCVATDLEEGPYEALDTTLGSTSSSMLGAAVREASTTVWG